MRQVKSGLTRALCALCKNATLRKIKRLGIMPRLPGLGKKYFSHQVMHAPMKAEINANHGTMMFRQFSFLFQKLGTNPRDGKLRGPSWWIRSLSRYCSCTQCRNLRAITRRCAQYLAFARNYELFARKLRSSE
jgi:hypothetical protein